MRVRVERVDRELAIDDHLAVPRQDDRARRREGVEIRLIVPGLEIPQPCEPLSLRRSRLRRQRAEAFRLNRRSRRQSERACRELPAGAALKTAGVSRGRFGAVFPADDDRVELASEHRGDDGSGNDAGSRDSDDDARDRTRAKLSARGRERARRTAATPHAEHPVKDRRFVCVVTWHFEASSKSYSSVDSVRCHSGVASAAGSRKTSRSASTISARASRSNVRAITRPR